MPRPLSLLSALLLSTSILCVDARSADPKNDRRWEVFPVAAYDSNTGFGLGIKSFFLDQLDHRESFDLTLYASTRGERWVKGVASFPDFNLRQGTLFPLGLDLKVEYDRMIQSKFFGVGNRARFSDRETFNKEPLTVEAAASRPLTRRLLALGGIRYRTISNSRAMRGGLLEAMEAPNLGRVVYGSVFLGIQYDTRDSYLRPRGGWWWSCEIEATPASVGAASRLVRGELCGRRFIPLAPIRSVLALRLRAQALDHRDVPVQALLSLGGGDTLRGYAQDRFLDCASLLANAELRCPLYRRLGGVLGIDGGKVWGSFSRADLKAWPLNAVVGLRFMMDTFTVRGDAGFGREETGLYLSFGQVF